MYFLKWVCSSVALERIADTDEVEGSSPSIPTICRRPRVGGLSVKQELGVSNTPGGTINVNGRVAEWI